MNGPLLRATTTGSGAQFPVPSGPVTAKVSVAGHSGCRSFCPVTETSWAKHSSLLNTASTGPRTLAPGFHFPLFTRLQVTAHTQWRRNASQELTVKWPQAPVMVHAVHALNLTNLETSTAVSRALAPVSHSPASTGAQVALLSRIWPLNVGAVSVHPGATLHTPPVGPQPTGGRAFTPISNNPVCRAVVLHEMLVIGSI